MRGFPQNRFFDRSAVYYTVEYRHTLNWNPLKDNSILSFYRMLAYFISPYRAG